jgi:hypothetical protein
MNHNGSPRRIKLNLDDLRVESFEPLSASKTDGGTIRGYDTFQTCQTECESACPTECDSCQGGCSGLCASFDTCPAVCATTVQMC